MSRRQLLKLKAELDAFDLKLELRDLERQQTILELQSINLQMQQNQLEALSLWFQLKREAEHPTISIEDPQNQSEVDFNLPPVFDNYGEEEEEKEEKVAENQEEHQKEIEVKDDEGKVLILSGLQGDEDASRMNIFYSRYTIQDKVPLFPFEFHKNEPQNSHDHLSPFLTYDKPSLKAPNSKIRASKEWDRDVPNVIPQNQIQIGKGNECKRVLKTKKDLFAWLILFQPLTSSLPPSLLSPMFFFSSFKPLTQKFCHKDKWKELKLVT